MTEFAVYPYEQVQAAKTRKERNKLINDALFVLMEDRAERFGELLQSLPKERHTEAATAAGFGMRYGAMMQRVISGKFYPKQNNARGMADLYLKEHPEVAKMLKSTSLQAVYFGEEHDFNVPYEEDLFLTILCWMPEDARNSVIKNINDRFNRYPGQRMPNDPIYVFCERIYQGFTWVMDPDDIPASLPLLYPKLASMVKDIRSKGIYDAYETQFSCFDKGMWLKPSLAISALWDVPLDYFFTPGYLTKDLIKYAKFSNIEERLGAGRATAARKKLTPEQIKHYHRVLNQFAFLNRSIRKLILHDMCKTYITD